MTCGAHAAETSWKFVPKGTQKLVQVAAGGQHVWGRDSDGNVYKWNMGAEKWEQKFLKTVFSKGEWSWLPVKAHWITVRRDGKVYGLVNGKAHELTGDRWKVLGGGEPELARIYACESKKQVNVVFAVTKGRKWFGQLSNQGGLSWRWIRFPLVTFDKFIGGKVEGKSKEHWTYWGLRGNSVYPVNNLLEVTSTLIGISVIPGRLKDISVGPSGKLWGIGMDGVPYSLDKKRGFLGISALAWTRCAPPGPGNLVSISVASDEEIWVITKDGTVGRWVNK